MSLAQVLRSLQHTGTGDVVPFPWVEDSGGRRGTLGRQSHVDGPGTLPPRLTLFPRVDVQQICLVEFMAQAALANVVPNFYRSLGHQYYVDFV